MRDSLASASKCFVFALALASGCDDARPSSSVLRHCNIFEKYHFRSDVDAIKVDTEIPPIINYVFYPEVAADISLFSDISEQLFLHSQTHPLAQHYLPLTQRKSPIVVRNVSQSNPLKFSLQAFVEPGSNGPHVLVIRDIVSQTRVSEFELKDRRLDSVKITAHFHPEIVCDYDSADGYASNSVDLIIE